MSQTAAGTASNVSGEIFPWPKGYPASQQAALEKLSAAGQLSGIPPQFIAYIEEAETSGWSGGGINSAGAGGYFGLKVNGKYPAGTPSKSLLDSGGASDTPSFEAQAVIAASEFASLLTQFGGDPIKAENAYQGGPNQSTTALSQIADGGAKIFASYLGESPADVTPASQAGGVTPDDPISKVASATGLSGITGLADEALSVLEDVTSASFWERLGTGVLGIGLFVVGLVIFSSSTDTGKKAISEGETAAAAGAVAA